ncbi:DoxX family protein [Acinetobacter sp. IK31]|uniref:DoxX family protein n=1 Tax=unclassified Acinetobacter TaxID=196816 RepID=UPI0021CD92EE|nr:MULTISPECIES: DoxX family protein [unclassified Acinetobacter]MCU4423655.1 DoxX family protein [Acinetobacter sp. WU_MDCI_Abxb74]MEB3866009.1 DoxX family protein [Acinetobacter sp. IK31]
MASLIQNALASNYALVIGRIVLSSFFLIAGIFGVFNFDAVVNEMIGANLPLPQLFAFATIAVQLVGSILLISNFAGLTWLGAGILAVFTLLCIPVGHPFWELAEPQRTQDFQIVLEHIALTGGLLLAAIATKK